MSTGIARTAGAALAVSLLVAVSGPAVAAWNDECRVLAQRLASEPGALKTGELDILKSCLSDLQRSQILGETIPPTTTLPPSCPVVPPPTCPVCAVCAGAETDKPAAPAAPPKAKPKPRNREDDRRLKPYLPQY